MKKVAFVLTLVLSLAPSTTFASIIFNNYTCASHWTGSWAVGSVTCSSDTLHFTTADTQQAANNGTGNTLIDISNSGAGRIVYLTLDNGSATGNLKYGCFGSATNCSFSNLSAGHNSELILSVPVQSTGGNFAYLVFQNNSGTAAGDISNICIDDDGTSCGGSGASSSTVNRLAKFTTTTQTLGDSLFSDDGSNITLTAGNLFMQIGSIIDTLTSGILNFGTATATTMTFGRTGQNMIINSNVGIGTTSPLSRFSIGTAGNAFRISSIGTVEEGVWHGTPIAVSYGGTGTTSLTGLLQGNGTSAVTAITGTAGQFPYYKSTNTLAATSSISIAPRGQVSIGTTTTTSTLNLGNDNGTSNGSTTIMMGKLQFDGYNSAGVRRCVFLNSANTFTSSAGPCK
jgi:hypothetical protein